MKPIHNILATLAIIISAALFSSCHETPDYPDDPIGNFDALADIIDTRYCFFAEKDIDWAEVRARYRAKVKADTGLLELFQICSDMLDELRDGHVNLVSSFNTSYYRKWWTDYPQDFNARTLQQYYLDFDYYSTSGISYKILGENQNIGYMRYPSFSSGIGELNLDYVLAILHHTDALIIDIRDNGGGLLTNVGILVSRFITQTVPGGFIQHKTGPGHSDFSDLYPFEYHPCESYRISYHGPIMVLTNRSCYSAANDFTAVMKQLPNVRIVGARTGGGGGLPFSSELPNGWMVRFSASPVYGPDGNIIEFGIEPSPGCEVHCTAGELAAGKDAILDLALSTLTAETAD